MIKAVIFDMFETLITHYDSPLYFGVHIAKELGIEHSVFNKTWKCAEEERMTGRLTLEELLEIVLKANNVYSETLLKDIARKRYDAKKEVLNHIHKDIIPLLSELKKRGILLGLISNCYSEEVELIEKSELYPYFDAVCLSYTEKVMKPDLEIFRRCTERLGVKADECLYIGDGGSDELEAAERTGMHPYQALWYLNSHDFIPTGLKESFENLNQPMDILKII